MNQKEKHHVIPISMWGWDVPANILRLKKTSHDQIHDAQNLKYQRLREFRRKTNGLDPRSNDFKQHYLGLLLQYFCGALFLPAGLVRAQALAIKKLTYYAAEQTNRTDKVVDCPYHDNRPFLVLTHWVIQFVAVYMEIGMIFNHWLFIEPTIQQLTQL